MRLEKLKYTETITPGSFDGKVLKRWDDVWSEGVNLRFSNPGGQEFKMCPACEAILPVEEFSRNRAQRDGRQVYCRKCVHQGGVSVARVVVCGQEKPNASDWGPRQRARMDAVESDRVHVYVMGSTGVVWRWRRFRHPVAGSLEEFVARRGEKEIEWVERGEEC